MSRHGSLFVDNIFQPKVLEIPRIIYRLPSLQILKNTKPFHACMRNVLLSRLSFFIFLHCWNSIYITGSLNVNQCWSFLGIVSIEYFFYGIAPLVCHCLRIPSVGIWVSHVVGCGSALVILLGVWTVNITQTISLRVYIYSCDADKINMATVASAANRNYVNLR